MKDYDAPERWRKRRSIAILIVTAFVIAVAMAMLKNEWDFVRLD